MLIAGGKALRTHSIVRDEHRLGGRFGSRERENLAQR